jgi:hypothetical protein
MIDSDELFVACKQNDFSKIIDLLENSDIDPNNFFTPNTIPSSYEVNPYMYLELDGVPNGHNIFTYACRNN